MKIVKLIIDLALAVFYGWRYKEERTVFAGVLSILCFIAFVADIVSMAVKCDCSDCCDAETEDE